MSAGDLTGPGGSECPAVSAGGARRAGRTWHHWPTKGDRYAALAELRWSGHLTHERFSALRRAVDALPADPTAS
ncbi:hypothetical protein GCM10011594_31800 [Nakamurella endophytica]|uniref:Uncharacterized protein n=1 Tax=Nakamurella endophytica TaxID=1748367 RepID=A0A917T4V7_9ACTN|nr:hypothetical protein GCM10011594_31800 [Nakamurella endophytica]